MHIKLTSGLSPGDILTMTAAVESLHRKYPEQYKTSVSTTCMEIWENNPWIEREGEPDNIIEMHYPSIQKCNQVSIPFLAGYTTYLGDKLGIELDLQVNRPYLYLSDDEKKWINQLQQYHHAKGPFWLLNAGVKEDYTTKQWPIEYYQEVVNSIKEIQWVQIGAREHKHPVLNGVINLVGQTDHRQLIRLVHHSSGGLGPVTYLQHLCAALEKPYILLLGGREPVIWTQYPLQHTLHTIGMLSCCKDKACWKSRVPGDCEAPILGWATPFPKCMGMIKPEEVICQIKKLL